LDESEADAKARPACGRRGSVEPRDRGRVRPAGGTSPVGHRGGLGHTGAPDGPEPLIWRTAPA